MINMLKPATPRKGAKTTHAVSAGCLSQLDLPVRPGFLTAARVIEANVPRITGPDWLIFYPSPVTFSIALPAGLKAGTVVEWEDRQHGSWRDWLYTVVTAVSETSVAFAHAGRGPDGALAAAMAANTIRERLTSH
jgi:hypothetical protein